MDDLYELLKLYANEQPSLTYGLEEFMLQNNIVQIKNTGKYKTQIDKIKKKEQLVLRVRLKEKGLTKTELESILYQLENTQESGIVIKIDGVDY